MNNHPPYIEKALFARIAEGEEAALDELYEHFGPKMEGFVLKLMKQKDAVKDVLQEAMIRLWLHRDKLPEVSHPLTWFFKIIANECFRYMRRKGASKVFLEELAYSRQHDASHHTELAVAYQETQRIIREVVFALPARHREIYRLSREEGLKMQEIADRTGLSFQYVKKVLVTTLRTVREQLKAMGRYTVLLPFWIFFLK